MNRDTRLVRAPPGETARDLGHLLGEEKKP